MEQDKTKILSDLYAIRATMSVVAELDDAVQPERIAVEMLSNELSRADSLIESSKNDLEITLDEKRDTAHTQLNELYKEREEREKKLAEEKGRRDWYEKELSRAKKKCSIFEYLRLAFIYDFFGVDSIPFDILVGLLIVGVIVSFSCGSLWSHIGYWTGFLYNILITVSIILLYTFITTLSFALYNKHFYGKHDRNGLMRCNYEIERNSKRLQEIEPKIEELKKVYAAYDEHLRYATSGSKRWGQGISQIANCKADETKYYYAEIDKLIQEHEERVTKLEGQKKEFERQKKLHQEVVNANAEKTALIVKEGAAAYPLIDFRDWENVDLLIYYFETGRADDMKEALQLVDKQRQTDQITRAIAMASASICKTFDNTMRQLGSSLAQSFSVLSRQLSRQHAEMMYQMDQQAVDWREMSEAQNRELRGLREQAAAEMNMQVSAQAMNQALLNKISVSSNRLADQMDRQMREVHGLY